MVVKMFLGVAAVLSVLGLAGCQSTTAKSSTHPGLLHCCTAECAKMDNCCKSDDKGKIICVTDMKCCKKEAMPGGM